MDPYLSTDVVGRPPVVDDRQRDDIPSRRAGRVRGGTPVFTASIAKVPPIPHDEAIRIFRQAPVKGKRDTGASLGGRGYGGDGKPISHQTGEDISRDLLSGLMQPRGAQLGSVKIVQSPAPLDRACGKHRRASWPFIKDHIRIAHVVAAG